MEQVIGYCGHEHVVNIPRGNMDSLSSYHVEDRGNLDELHYDNGPSTGMRDVISQSSSTSSNASNSTSVSFTRIGDNSGRSRQRNPLNSGLWISVELVINLSQIIAAVLVLSFSFNEHPKSPLCAWVIGYTAGCLATLPHLCWRFIHRNQQMSEHGSGHGLQVPSQGNSQGNVHKSASYNTYSPHASRENGHDHTMAVMQSRHASLNVNTRMSTLVDHYKMSLDCFFAIWFVVGTVWTFGGHSSEFSAPNMYKLCIVFLTFSCIGYAMSFVLISVLGFREDRRPQKGATLKVIIALPTYKFIAKRSHISEDSGVISDQPSEGGILASRSKKERIVFTKDGCRLFHLFGEVWGQG